MTSILAPTNCTECLGFEIERPATCVASYWPSSQNGRNGQTEFLCDSCASNSRTYCSIRPLAKAPEAPKATPSPFAPWFDALLAQNIACTHRPTFEKAAYEGYISYSLSMTDGYFAPKDFEAWVIGFRKDPINALYGGNDARHALAPQANDYIAGLPPQDAITCACGEELPNWVDNGFAPTCIGCILQEAADRRASDRRTLTKETGRTW